MKKLIFALSVSSLILASCKKDTPATNISNVSSAYKSVMFEYTASWCPPCGAYAFDVLEETYHSNPYTLCGISIHPKDDVASGSELGVSELKTFYNFSGTPQLGVNTEKQMGFTTDKTYNKNQINNKLNLSKGKKAKAGIGISKTVSGSTLEIKTKTVFFEALTGNYNLAIYVTEDGLVAEQENHTPAQVTHNNVFRGAVNGSFGKNITSAASANQVIEETYSFTIPAAVKNSANLHVTAVLWKMDGANAVEVVNCNRD